MLLWLWRLWRMVSGYRRRTKKLYAQLRNRCRYCKKKLLVVNNEKTSICLGCWRVEPLDRP